MGIRKRVSALLLAVLLSFGVCAVDYLKVDALEVGGSVVWDTAINYLLGLLGLSPIAENGDKIVDFDSMRSKWVQDYEAYFYANVQPEDLPEGYTKERAYQNWIDNVCRGNLNTVEYGAWDIFKEWAETLPSESSGGGSGDFVNGVSFEDSVNFISDYFGLTVSGSLPSSLKRYNVYAILGNNFNRNGIVNNSINFIFLLSPNLDYSVSYVTNSNSMVYPSGGFVWANFGFDSVSKSLNLSNSFGLHTSGTCYVSLRYSDVIYYNNISVSNYPYDAISLSNASVSSEYAVVNDKVTDLQIINDYSTTTTQNVVSIDWDKIGAMISDAVGTVTGSLDRTITDALDDAQEKVAAGTMSVANYNDYVTEISNTYVYDITNETSITNPDSTVTGVITGNVENAEFVLKGLQYVFPFCIPWDIKDFVTLLVADPVAPVIEYPIYNPVTDTDEIITIDFSLWENQVRIIRYIFDFLLIIGLLLLARSLIGAGGSD